jgi:phosphonopyruvate decarboxylase
VIEASQFVEPAKQLGFNFWAGVPCSYLTPFINYTIDDEGLNYISSANEGDAVAAASGASLGGMRAVAMMQNSGLGNAVSPLTSLNHVFQIPILLIVTLRGEPGQPDEPQHELMGQVTQQLLETMGIPWSWFPEQAEDIESVLHDAVTHMDTNHRPYALVMRKGAVAPYVLQQDCDFQKHQARTQESDEDANSGLPTRQSVLRELVNCTDVANTLVIASTGFAGRELYAIEDRVNHLYMVGSMGCASSLGLGLSLARPDQKVIVVDGDGAALMRMGNFATIGAYADGNYYHLLLDNQVHESTGGQATVSSGIDFSAIARACGYRSVYDCGGTSQLNSFLQNTAPSFMQVRIQRGVPENLPRPSITPADVTRRLQQHMQRHLRSN